MSTSIANFDFYVHVNLHCRCVTLCLCQLPLQIFKIMSMSPSIEDFELFFYDTFQYICWIICPLKILNSFSRSPFIPYFQQYVYVTFQIFMSMSPSIEDFQLYVYVTYHCSFWTVSMLHFIICPSHLPYIYDTLYVIIPCYLAWRIECTFIHTP